MEKMGFGHERRSLQPSWVWVREREPSSMWLREREGARGQREREREREGFGTKMRRVWLVRDKIVF